MVDRPTLKEWRDEVRPLLQSRIKPENITWETSDTPVSLFASCARPIYNDKAVHAVTLSKSVLGSFKRVLCHRDPKRFDHMYRLAFDLQSKRGVLNDPTHVSALWIRNADKAIRRDIHKMHAFVRFRKTGEIDGKEVFCAWFEPDHPILSVTADFFQRRFTGMRWSILTPDESAHWNGEHLRFSGPATKDQAPASDDMDSEWRAYYASIFNPSRVKISAMQSEMPKKYWKNLPEAEIISELIRDAGRESQAFMTKEPTETPERAKRIKAQRNSN